jgi:hypothetical protein
VITRVPEPDLTSLFGSDVPVYFNAHGLPSFQNGSLDVPFRVLVASIPKSGTYLLGKVLAETGLVDTRIHIHGGGESFTDYRFSSLEFGRRNSEALYRKLPLQTVISLVAPGQFVVGHLAARRYDRQWTDIKPIFLYRNLRDSYVSFMRWQARTGRGTSTSDGWGSLPEGPEKLLRWDRLEGGRLFNAAKRMLKWKQVEHALAVSYEELNGDQGHRVQRDAFKRLLNFLGIGDRIGIEGLIAATVNAETMTFNKTPESAMSRETYWSERVEEAFRSRGLHELNSRLGYEDT